MRDQNELAYECLDAEENGDGAVAYLKSLGYISAKATWERLKLNELGMGHGKKNGGLLSMKRLTLDQKKKAVEIAISGEDPLVYLKRIGIKNASGAWYYLKKTLKTSDPDLYAKIPERTQNKRETDPSRPKKEAEEPEATAEPMQEEQDDTPPKFRFLEIETALAKYTYHDGDLVIMQKGCGEGLRMCAAECYQLVKELPEIVRIMEVE